MLYQIVNEKPKPLRAVAPHATYSLERIVMQCLEKDPAKRYATAQTLADDLQRFLNNEPISARPITCAAKPVMKSISMELAP